MSAEDLRGRILELENDKVRLFSNIAAHCHALDLSATQAHRSQPLLKCEGPSLRRAMLWTSTTVVLMSSTPPMVREPVA